MTKPEACVHKAPRIACRFAEVDRVAHEEIGLTPLKFL
jgi:hypothetical protein